MKRKTISFKNTTEKTSFMTSRRDKPKTKSKHKTKTTGKLSFSHLSEPRRQPTVWRTATSLTSIQALWKNLRTFLKMKSWYLHVIAFLHSQVLLNKFGNFSQISFPPSYTFSPYFFFFLLLLAEDYCFTLNFEFFFHSKPVYSLLFLSIKSIEKDIGL